MVSASQQMRNLEEVEEDVQGDIDEVMVKDDYVEMNQSIDLVIIFGFDVVPF